MEITCSHCKTGFTLPKDRLPDAKKFKVNCPKCKTTLIVENQAAQGPVKIPENFPHDAVVAFLYVPDEKLAERIGAFLKDQGIYVSEAKTSKTAREKVKLNYYQMLILEEGVVSQEILQIVKKWDGLRRRDVNII